MLLQLWWSKDSRISKKEQLILNLTNTKAVTINWKSRNIFQASGAEQATNLKLNYWSETQKKLYSV